MSDCGSEVGRDGTAQDFGDDWNLDEADRGDAITHQEIFVRDDLAGGVDDDCHDPSDEDVVNEDEEFTIVQGHCPICLKELVRGVLIKDCLHEFCFDCITMWAKHLAARGALPLKCPVCRAAFQVVLANLRSAHDYDTVDVLDASPSAFPAQRDQCPRRRRSLVYRRRLPTTAEWDPIRKTNDQGRPWIDRELRVLMGEDADTTLLLHVVFTYLDLARQQQKPSHRDPPTKRAKTAAPSKHPYASLCDAMRDFLHDDSDLFVHEVSKFMASHLNMAAYDGEAAVVHAAKDNKS